MDTNDIEQLDKQQHSSFLDFQHLNIDLCLELICPYLDLNDLSSVADSCMQMKAAAELTFAHKYRKRSFCMFHKEDGPICDETDESKVNIYKPKICLQVLRCFGQMISKLCLKCNHSTGILWTHFDEYIANYCVNYLTEFEIWSRWTDFDNLRITFPRVEKIRFSNCKLDGTIVEFASRFPKMRSLEFAVPYYATTEVTDQLCIANFFPYLEHLSINISDTRAKTIGFLEENILNALKLNPHLKSLNLFSICGSIGKEFIHAISKQCESLDTLQITGYPLRLDDIIHFKSVKHFKFNHIHSCFRTPIPLTFHALEAFDCHTYTSLPLIIDFVRLNPTIVKMKLSFFSECLTHDNIIEMKNAFAFVKEIEEINMLADENLTAKDISFFLLSLKSLQKLILRPSRNGFDNLLKLVKSLPHIPWIIDEKNNTIRYHNIQ